MENDNQTLIDTNIEAFKCEMRAFPHVEIASPELLRQNRDDLNKLGLVYYLGLGGPEDREEAKRLWAKSNDGEAKLFLSVDRFLENDLSGGVQLLAEASKMGVVLAQLRYAYCLILGIGIDADLGRAYKILKKLANDHVPCAVYFIGAMHMTREQTLVEYDPERAQKLLDWSIKNGCKFAQFEQGVVDLRKAKTEPAIARAFGLIEAAAEQDEPRAMFYYALALARGDRVKQDTERAQRYLDRCLQLGFGPAVDAVKEAVKKM